MDIIVASMEDHTVHIESLFDARFMKAPVRAEMLDHAFALVVPADVLGVDMMTTVVDHVQFLFPAGCPTHDRLVKALHRAFPEFAHLSLRDIYLQLLSQIELVRGVAQDQLYDFLEFFAGEANLTRGMLEAGFRAKAFDVVYNEVADVEHDLKVPQGFRYWVLSLCFTCPGADQWHGIVCSSWVFMSRPQTKRSLNQHVPARIWGDESRELVASGNDFAIKVTFMCSLGLLCRVNFIIEQPLSSILSHFPCVERLLSLPSVMTTSTFLGNFGAASQKPVKFWHTASWVKQMKTGRPANLADFVSLVRRGPNGRVTGILKEMKQSQAYPVQFGRTAGVVRKLLLRKAHADPQV